MQAITIIRLPAVCALTGLSRSTLFQLENARRFPVHRQLSTRAVGWVRGEVEEWIASRPPCRVPVLADA